MLRPGRNAELPRLKLVLGVAATGLGLCFALACGHTDGSSSKPPKAPPAPDAASEQCPARAPAPSALPGTTPAHQTLAHWLSAYSPAELDAVLLSAADIEHYNQVLGRRPGGDVASQRDLLEPISFRALRKETRERLSYLAERVADGRLVGPDGQRLTPEAYAPLRADAERPAFALHVALDAIPIRCGPLEHALYEAGSEKIYDRNACSTIRAQEPLRVLASWPSGMQLVETRYSRGFIARNAPLSPVVPAELDALIVQGPRGRIAAATELVSESGTKHALPEDTTLPLTDDGHGLLATTVGFGKTKGALSSTRRPLTRRALLTTAFEMLDTPYGFGDANGGRDCSRLLMDLFESFDLALPRHSGWQAQAGSFRVDVSKLDRKAKLARLAEVAQHSSVLLAFPGHIMLYLGKREDGAPMVLHALGEYVKPCRPEGETVLDVQRTVVSDLTLGEGSSRRSLIDRVTSLVAFGKLGPEVAGAKPAPVAPPVPPPQDHDCKDSLDARIFVSPALPTPNRPMRVIATATQVTGRTSLFVYDADGKLAPAASERHGGPPFSIVSEVGKPEAGRYTVLFTEGEQVIGCKRVTVRTGARAQPAQSPGVWEPRFRWERDTENLYSAFVEHLFDDPPDDERTFDSLHALLRDPQRNFLFDHFGLEEDEAISLVPDCADLPFALRAYFSWKLSLPFAFRQCARGRTGVPPTCGPLHDNLMAREAPNDVAAFSVFVNRRVRSGVHSATGRTHPQDDATDLYPVALDRSSLTPGTVYADPYGHVLVVTSWIAQPENGYGILIGAEAQPDNTVGRRRFSRGSFLFDPSTTDVGAGFKRFRPLTFDRPTRALLPLDNAALRNTDEHVRFSTAQYEQSVDDFYERMDALINPKPLDPEVRMRSLLDGLEEAVRRRVLSVDLGEQNHKQQARLIPMPIGHEVFETTGPWEDYSTPSRDLRLLIALDEVTSLPDRVASRPERFNLAQGTRPDAESERIRKLMAAELERRTFTYTRSDGSPMALTLAAIQARAAAFELAYNPNDCAELRWGAPEGSPELATCTRRAPQDQQTRMERYRVWWKTRTRPARGARGP